MSKLPRSKDFVLFTTVPSVPITREALLEQMINYTLTSATSEYKDPDKNEMILDWDDLHDCFF
jgi:hypothetical protein